MLLLSPLVCPSVAFCFKRGLKKSSATNSPLTGNPTRFSNPKGFYRRNLSCPSCLFVLFVSLLVRDSKRSTDVDECAERLDSCLHGMEMCINDLGRYHCEPLSADSSSTAPRRISDIEADEDDEIHDPTLCPPGYTYDEDEQVCIGSLLFFPFSNEISSRNVYL